VIDKPMFMPKIKLLGNARKALGDNTLEVKISNIDELIDMLKDKGINQDELLILVNGVELSLIDNKALNDNDVITIASIVHGG
jgi:molybdopterin converting factor small subunit